MQNSQPQETTKTVNPAKLILSNLSDDLKLAQKMGQLPTQFDNCETCNDLLRVYYKIDHLECKTFNQWKAEGKMVKKGEKGFCFWTAPLQGKTKTTDAATQETTENKYKFFSICYLFTQLQVQ